MYLHDRRGVALMLVLWLIVVLGVTAAGIAAAARGEVRFVNVLRARATARYAAESGIVATVARFRELVHAAETDEARAGIYGQLRDELTQSGEQQIGDASYQVAIEDLSSRIDLNLAEESVVLDLFHQLFDERTAVELADALQDWIDPDNDELPQGAEAQHYERLGSPFRPTNQPLLRLDELARITGFTDSVAEALAPYVTIWGDGRVNVNTAPQPVLAAIPEIGPIAAEYILSARERGIVLTNTAMVYQEIVDQSGGSIVPYLADVSTMPGHVLIIARGWLQGHPLTHEVQAVFALEGIQLPDGPYVRMVHWTERDR